MVAQTTHGVVEDADDEHGFAVVLKDDEVVDLNLVRSGELLLAVGEEHLAEAAE